MKLKLEPLKLEHTKDLQKVLNNKDVIKTLTGIPFPFTEKDSKKYIKNSISDEETYEFAIILEDNFAGTIVLENPNSNKKIFEVGYVIAKPYWGKGIATKALTNILKIAFDELKLRKVWAATISNNPGSAKVLEKAGFELEGELKKHHFTQNRYYDEFIYGFLNTKYVGVNKR